MRCVGSANLAIAGGVFLGQSQCRLCKFGANLRGGGNLGECASGTGVEEGGSAKCGHVLITCVSNSNFKFAHELAQWWMSGRYKPRLTGFIATLYIYIDCIMVWLI